MGGERPSSVPTRRDAGSQGVGRAVGGGSKGGGGDAGAPGEDTRACALSATSLASLNATDAGDVSSRHVPEGGFVRRDDGPGASCHREIADSTAGPVGGGGVLFGLAVAAGTRGRSGDADSSAFTTASAVSPTSPTASGFIYSDRDEAVCACTHTQTHASACIHDSRIHRGMCTCAPLACIAHMHSCILNRILILDLHACIFRMMVRTKTTPTSKGLATRPRLGRERVNALLQRWCWRRGNREKGGQGGAEGALRCRLGLNRCVCVCVCE